MDRGHIPGFWYDEEKKKYFKIQADHQLPSEAQYSNGKVKRQRRKAKQQKSVQGKRRARDQQTVRRSRLLDDPSVGGIGLRRELGNISSCFAWQLSDASLVSQWRATRVYVLSHSDLNRSLPFQLIDAEYVPGAGRLVTADLLEESLTVHGRVAVATENFYRVSAWDIDWLPKLSSRVLEDLENTKRGTTSTPPGTFGTVFGCHTPGTVISGVETDGICGTLGRYKMGLEVFDVPFMLNLSTQLDISLHESTHFIAVREFGHVVVYDHDLHMWNRIRVGHGSTIEGEDDSALFCPTIDWLDAQTVVYGDNNAEFGEKGRGRRPAVMLWDIRSTLGQVARFTVRHRITGVLTADNSGCRIFVSTNYHIYLFDTRCGDDALMKLPNVHEGPQCQFATNKLGLLAAVDRDNVIQVYSTWSRNRIGSLKMPRRQSGKPDLFESRMIRRPRWYDGGCEGPGLTACQGGSVLRWSWQDHASDDLEDE